MSSIKDFTYIHNSKVEIQEVQFAEYFKEKYKVYYFSNRFFNEYGMVEDVWVARKIQDEIASVTSKPSTMVDRLLKTLKRTALITELNVQGNILNCNNKSFLVTSKGLKEQPAPENYLIKFKYDYNLNAPKPQVWLSFLDNLLEQEDIDLLQKYMGYCLLPTTKLQQALFIIGQGGEGKSRIGLIMEKLWGNFIVKSKIHKIEQDRFVTATLVNSLVFLDDDLSSAKILDTGIVKELITNEGSFYVEQKGKDLSKARVFVKFIGFGNNVIESVDDLSEGWFRRFKFIKCKEKGKRVDDVHLINRMYQELDGIFMWCIEGLEKLIADNWILGDTASSRACNMEMRSELWVIDNFIFSQLEFGENYEIYSKRLADKYIEYCSDNEIEPLTRKTFLNIFNKRIQFHKSTIGEIKRSENINTGEGRRRGYKGVRLKLDKGERIR